VKCTPSAGKFGISVSETTLVKCIKVKVVVDKVALGQVFPCQSSFHQLLRSHPHLSSGAGTIGQKWPQYKGLCPTPLAIKKTKTFSQASGVGPTKETGNRSATAISENR
jgi:hypothetical protein